MTAGLCQIKALANGDGVETSLRVVVAEDDVLLRESLASLFEDAGFDVVGQAATVTSCSRWSATRRPIWWWPTWDAAEPEDGCARRCQGDPQ
jgi:hypothetical protein